MSEKTIYNLWHIILPPIIAAFLSSCTPSWEYEMVPSVGNNTEDAEMPDRKPAADNRKVLLLYSAGFNSISSYLQEDIEDLGQGWLPGSQRNDDVLLVYSHLPLYRGRYTTPNSPVLFRMYKTNEGETIRDTLITYDETTISSSAEQLDGVLSYVKENFPAKSYGMIFSSHATGYLPAGFYGKADSYVFEAAMQASWGKNRHHFPQPVPYFEVNSDPASPAVKSVGQDVSGSTAYEMDLKDFAKAIPMKLDYILFDACLMGGIEAAYELAGKCDLVGFSQAEVLAEGFNYKTLTNHLLGEGQEADPVGVCEDYFVQYDIQTGVYRSATISVIDCNNLSEIAEFCKDAFEKYRDEIKNINHSQVQRFYRSRHHWFYDLESILINAGITEEEKQELHNILEGCVIYKGNTPEFMSEFKIHTFSGFSMYLPCNGTSELDKYYQTLKWNKDTGLVLN